MNQLQVWTIVLSALAIVVSVVSIVISLIVFLG